MCGIAGVVGRTGARPAVEKMLDAIAHRGPDARAVVEDGPIAVGHVRLSILDLDARSDQPFVTEAGNVLAYNGELWNYRELRAELEAEGETFRTAGDTEVVALALESWGAAAFERFNGMFALAWWRRGDRALTLARDRFGEVPLHVARLGDSLFFASELKALPRGTRALSKWVEPGELAVLRADRGGATYLATRYYEAPEDCSGLGEELGSIAVAGALRQGVHERAISDVPACTLLSGGMDSSAIAVLLKEKIPNLVAFVAVMDPKSLDAKRAREVADFAGLPLVKVKVPPPTVEDLQETVRTIETPAKAQVEIGWACLKLADAMRAEGFKVTFSGEGSDELWAAYNHGYHLVKEKGWHRARKELFLDQARKNFPRCNKAFLSRGVECRLPFLSPGLVETALRLPMETVWKGGFGASPADRKAVLSRAIRGLVPASVERRARLAFQAGLGMREQAASVVADPARFYRAVFDQEFR